MTTPPADTPHRRRNPLTGGWVLVSPQRALRPWEGEQLPGDTAPRPEHDPDCPLCPGGPRIGGRRMPDYAGPFAFDNDFPALRADIPPQATGNDDPLFVVRPARGAARVLCYSPHHGRTLAELDPAEVRAVVDLWCDESAALGRRWPWVQVFENRGAAMGSSLQHPHGQVWAADHLPHEPTLEDHAQRDWLAAHGRPLLSMLAEREAGGPRVVVQHAEWLVIVPFWASWPFETLLLPRFEVQQLPQLDGARRDSLGRALSELIGRYDGLFGTRFPYSMGWHGAPFGSTEVSHWRLHAHFYPPLLRSATVRKHMVGYEMMAEPQRDLGPEQAAQRLRAVAWP